MSNNINIPFKNPRPKVHCFLKIVMYADYSTMTDFKDYIDYLQCKLASLSVGAMIE